MGLIYIEDLSLYLCSNRTYVSAYINENYNLSFRDWVAKLRVDYSKELLVEFPEYSIDKIAQQVGYARSSYVASFTKICKVSPARWREQN
ncbi:MAG: AraC family transcriptional regulator [Rikenellaceae bacterium]